MASSVIQSAHVPLCVPRRFSSPTFAAPFNLTLPARSCISNSFICQAVDIPATSGLDSGTGEFDSAKVLLEVCGLKAVIAETRQEILKGVNLIIREGEVLIGHPDYEVTGGSVTYEGENLLEMEPENRSLVGLFMTFQSPVEIPGSSNDHFLRMAYNVHVEEHRICLS